MAGLLLAAGAGRRMGRPKALVAVDGEPLVGRGWRALVAAGLAPRVVVLGAGHEQACAALPPGADAVVALDWAQGMGASLREGLAAVAERDPDGAVVAVVVTLVDTPGIGATALRRVAAQGVAPDVLARGLVDGAASHPVLLGRAHWAGIARVACGDVGARDYLRGRTDVVGVEIGDVADPVDVDTPADLDDLVRRRPDRS